MKLLALALATAALAVPIEERQSCSSTWAQCGGIGWTGPTCCSSGNTCVEQGPYYSQCLPASQVTTTKTSTSSAGTSSASSPPTQTPTKTSASSTSASATTPPAGSGTATWEGNPFADVKMWANGYYKSEILSLAVPSLSGAQATAAAKVAEVPSFLWMDTRAKVPLMEATLADIRVANKAGANPPNAGLFVVYDLPDRDCAAAASNGELSIADGGVAKYKGYIDSIREVILKYPDVRVLLVIEPDSLANMITNLSVQKCVNAEAAYLECTNYAVKQLNLPNVAMYLDGGHAGWLGWPANIKPAADMYAKVYKDAGSPKALRGLATNVSNYNGWNLTFVPEYTKPNPNYDEIHYVQAFAPLLSAAGFPAHFITDTGRSGKQPTGQIEQGHWCNVIGAGFGARPTSNTGLDVQDAFVWVKPGGECDGTSDTSAARYDHHCGLEDALKPAPEAGQWFQAYFVQLLTNANPKF
ncbi:probable cellulose 1,4-beta-cellobiosidase II precursor [Cephalotrichum gorgonifer]|uniref:Glucanase n=1 Tax=Cephalotrichum gorgonifer TaxID=2041049 RepID=A0AAE8MYT8_9PEZI|nr:probable cellulose 1,4-beta-cellobiosidase II precursor [Cephalotrichum gorgonifer]